MTNLRDMEYTGVEQVTSIAIRIIIGFIVYYMGIPTETTHATTFETIH